jgi:putative flavoprotein involved in K+ transport
MAIELWYCTGSCRFRRGREYVSVVLRPKQLVLATGMSGIPNVPEIPGAHTFKGKQHHSGKHTGGEDYSGKIPVYKQMADRDAELYARLKKAGFSLDFGGEGSGLFMKYLRRGSGYYIDVGASELIADGRIKLKSGVGIERIREHSLVLSDGTELPADLIVYATGYGSMNGWAARLISQEVADKVGKCWGLGSGTTKDPGPWEGELRNMWKPTRQPSLWFHGGNLHQSRHNSQFLSLQIKARMEGISTSVFGMSEVHHRS